jgi:hypothetical protein
MLVLWLIGTFASIILHFATLKACYVYIAVRVCHELFSRILVFVHLSVLLRWLCEALNKRKRSQRPNRNSQFPSI